MPVFMKSVFDIFNATVIFVAVACCVTAVFRVQRWSLKVVFLIPLIPVVILSLVAMAVTHGIWALPILGIVASPYGVWLAACAITLCLMRLLKGAMQDEKTQAILVPIAIVLCLILVPVVSGWYPNRSLPGRAIRFAFGRGLGVQEMQDLSSDIRSISRPGRLRLWAIDIMNRYQSGTLKLDTKARDYPLGAVTVSPDEIPAWIPAALRSTRGNWDGPEVTISLDDEGVPRYVVFAWYEEGFVIMGERIRPIMFGTYETEEAIPGVFTYYINWK